MTEFCNGKIIALPTQNRLRSEVVSAARPILSDMTEPESLTPPLTDDQLTALQMEVLYLRKLNLALMTMLEKKGVLSETEIKTVLIASQRAVPGYKPGQ